MIISKQKAYEATLVLLFCWGCSIAFLDKAYTVDEPCFLAIARHIQVDPWHPLDFSFNWYGRSLPMSRVNPNPPLVPYLFAAITRISHEREWLTRLLCFPVDGLAAVSLYFLASFFLKRPLWPTLLTVASPAFFICIPQVAAEKWVAAFGFSALCILVHALENHGERDGFDNSYWASASLMGLALLSKYSAVFFLPAALFYAIHKKTRWDRIALYLVLASLPALIYMVWSAVSLSGTTETILRHTLARETGAWYGWGHQIRSFLSFAGGTFAVSFCAWLLPRRENAGSVRWVLLGLSLLLFLPWLDRSRVDLLPRLVGMSFSWLALIFLTEAFTSRSEIAGAVLWMSWIASVSALQLFVYWSIASRFTLFLVPPLIFSAAAALESRYENRLPRWLYPVSLVATLGLSIALNIVDARYAGAQRDMAQVVGELYAGRRRIWFSGHWGLQYYMEKIPARPLDWSQGDWDNVHSGDVVVVPRVNSSVLYPDASKSRSLRVRTVEIAVPSPLRLTNSRAQAGFYSSDWGFLPFGFSRDSVDRFWVAEAR